MRIFKKSLLFVLFAVVFFLLAAMVGGVIYASQPDCETCGAPIATQFWIVSMAALQPVLWINDLRFATRMLIWFGSVVAGMVVYFLLEFAAVYVLSAESVTVAMQIGYAANLAGDAVAIVVSLLWSQSRRQTLQKQPAANVEP